MIDTITQGTTTTAATEQVIQQFIQAWHTQNKAVSKYFQKYDDAVYMQEVAPGRNRAIYLLGHLTSVSDNLLPLLGLGERLYPQLEELFGTNPDKTFEELPTVAELKDYWEKVSSRLAAHFKHMQTYEWLEPHTRVSEEDFAADPFRNKLNVLMSRTVHIGYHLGQLTLLKPEEPIA
ncbi:DinB superfamily protein [Filimonas lacunae]|uniref:DinB superfamily protein n=1 Tax=Filimonas lacunae TaxID=477680 RepID=A0A173M9Y2_9BACT|nr:DinB family protein [Filimonas lacunae]BAV04347.1 hypothetical protein FLA_0335 [Filimonas lacunae]SIT31092.1 DinB superfamily protein [Filimonas lacunae]